MASDEWRTSAEMRCSRENCAGSAKLRETKSVRVVGRRSSGLGLDERRVPRNFVTTHASTKAGEITGSRGCEQMSGDYGVYVRLRLCQHGHTWRRLRGIMSLLAAACNWRRACINGFCWTLSDRLYLARWHGHFPLNFCSRNRARFFDSDGFRLGACDTSAG